MTDEPTPRDEILEARLQEAVALVDDGRIVEAFELLHEQEADHPDDDLLLCTLGTLNQQLGREGIAYDYFRRCLATEPGDPAVLAMAGAGIALFDDPDAERVLRLAALTGPAVPLARLRYGAYLAREGLLDQAIAELEAARELDAASAEVRLALAGAYLRSGRLDDGIDELGAAAALEPDEDAARTLRALALHGAGRAAEAAEELYALAAELVDDGELQAAAALAFAEQGWDGEAWTALARADAAPDRPPDDLLAEVEAAIEDGADTSGRLLREEVGPPLLRDRMRLLD